jgi:hypothetical protein
MRNIYWYLASFLFISACNNQQAAEKITEIAPVAAIQKPAVAKPTRPSTDGTFCFKKVINQDVTNVQLVVSGKDVSGFMNWVPHQKDSGRGTLKGTKNKAGELDLMYDYMIEGSQQSETKIMKIDNETLWIKKGVLTDPNNDGRLVYKDASQAKYQEGLQAADCKTLTE